MITLLLILVGFSLLIAGYLSYQSATETLLKQTSQQLGALSVNFLDVGGGLNIILTAPNVNAILINFFGGITWMGTIDIRNNCRRFNLELELIAGDALL